MDIRDGYASKSVTIIHRSGDGSERVASADLLEHVLDIPKAQQTSAYGQRLARAMEHAGWKRNPGGRVNINGKPERGYMRRLYGPPCGQDVAPTGQQMAFDFAKPACEDALGVQCVARADSVNGLSGPTADTTMPAVGATRDLTGLTGPNAGAATPAPPLTD